MSIERQHDAKLLIKECEKILNDSKNFLERHKRTQEFHSHPFKLTKTGAKSSGAVPTQHSGQWLNTIPPIWNENLMKDYVEHVIDEFFELPLPPQSRCPSSSSAKSKDSENIERKADHIRQKLEKKDQAIAVNDSDFLSTPAIEEAEWKPIKMMAKNGKNEKDNLHISVKKQSPAGNKKSSSGVMKTKILTPLLKQEFNPRIKSKGNTPITGNRKTPSIKASPSSITTIHHQPAINRGQYLRFVGKLRAAPFDFNVEHPHLIIEESSAALFPCRLDKSTESGRRQRSQMMMTTTTTTTNEKVNEIPILSNRENLTDTIKDQITSERVNNLYTATLPSTDKTWHEVLKEKLLLEENTKMNKILRYKNEEEIKKLKEKQCAEMNIEAPEMTEKGYPYHGHDVIYNSPKIYRINEKQSTNHLQVQNLPILCIRGECKVQKVFQLSIAGGDKKANGSDDITNLNNVRVLQCNHEDDKGKKEFSVLNNGVKCNEAYETHVQDYKKELSPKPSVDSKKQLNIEMKDVNGKVQTENQFISNTTNKYLAPFILSNYIKDLPYEKNENIINSQSSTDTNTLEASQSSSNNDDDEYHSPLQIQNEKLRKRFPSQYTSAATTLTSSSSVVNLQKASEDQSKKIKEFHRTIPFSSSDGVILNFSHYENGQIPLEERPEDDVENILNEVFLGTVLNDDDDDLQKCKGTEYGKQKQITTTKAIGIDCADLNPGIEISVQTSDVVLDNYVQAQKENHLESNNLRAGGMGRDGADGGGKSIPAEFQLPQPLMTAKKTNYLVSDLVERICRDETEGIRNFKSRNFSSQQQQQQQQQQQENDISSPNISTHSRRSRNRSRRNVNEHTINDVVVSKPISKAIRPSNNVSTAIAGSGKHLVNEMVQVESSVSIAKSKSLDDDNFDDDGVKAEIINARINEVGGDNYTDNRKAIKGDEVEERCDQFDEVSLLRYMKFHSHLLGRKCCCSYHRNQNNDDRNGGDNNDDGEKKPYKSVAATNNINLQLNNTLSPTKLAVASKSQQSTFKGFQIEQNPKITKTINKLYYTAANIATKSTSSSSSNRMDPIVQRAVQKFLQSLSDEPQKVSSNLKYSTVPRSPQFPPRSPSHPQPVTSHRILSPLLSDGQISKGEKSTSISFSKSPRILNATRFPDVWKSKDSSISETEDSEIRRLLDTHLWNERSIRKLPSLPPQLPPPPALTTCTDAAFPRDENCAENLTESSISSSSESFYVAVPSLIFSSSVPKKVVQVDSISDGEVLSLGEVRDFIER